MATSLDKQIEIEFGSPNKIYNAGDAVTGSVVLKVDEQQDSANLQLKLCGKAMVAFSRDTGGKRREHFLDRENYVEIRVSLWPSGQRNTDGSQVLVVGHHEFPFSIRLPADVPSSFQSQAGNITYYLKAKLDMGGKSASVKEFFIVFQPLDLNAVYEARLPAEQEGDKTLCCLCCASGSVSARVHIPRRGFVPGETIPVEAEITNNSNSTITKTYFSVDQVSHCHAMGKTDTALKELKTSTPRVERGKINPGDTDRWTGDEGVMVPVTVPTGLEGCSIIDTQHRLTLNVVTPRLSFNLCVSVDIIIGTIPLRTGGYREDQDRSDSAPRHGSGFSSGRVLGRRQQEHDRGRHNRENELTWESGYITSQV